jgi:hypothetical protein
VEFLQSNSTASRGFLLVSLSSILESTSDHATQRSPVRLMVEAMRPGLPGLSSLSLELTRAGIAEGAMPLIQLLNQPGVALLLLLLPLCQTRLTLQ